MMFGKLRKWKRRGQRTLSLFLAIILTIGLLPPAVLQAAESFQVTAVTIGKTFYVGSSQPVSYITIEGKNLLNATVTIKRVDQGPVVLKNPVINSYGMVSFNVSEDLISSEIQVNGITIPVGEQLMPSLSTITPTTQIGSTVHIEGTNLLQIKAAGYTGKYGKEGGSMVSFADNYAGTNTAGDFPVLAGDLGPQDIIFSYSKSAVVDFPDYAGTNVSISIYRTYKDKFRIIQPLDIANVEMFPNRGAKGSTVTFKGDAPNLNEYDVFFVKDIGKSYIAGNAYKALNPTPVTKIDNKDYWTVEVPDIPLGDYSVVVTNKVVNDPAKEITREYLIGEKFTVVQAEKTPVILNIQPNTGPDSGSPAVISGVFLGSLNIDELKINTGIDNYQKTAITDITTLKITYSNNDGSPIGSYRDKPIISVTKDVNVIIGGKASCLEGSQLTPNLDKLNVLTPQVTDANTAPQKDVVVESVTQIRAQDGAVYTFKDRAVLPNGYTYIPSKIQPSISQVVPGKIQIDNANKLEKKLLVAIHGTNFFVQRYQNTLGETITNYPQVNLGGISVSVDTSGRVRINGIIQPSGWTFHVLDSTGKILDGSAGSDTGTKILLELPAGTSVPTSGKRDVTVTNPIRNSQDPGLSAILPDGVEFVQVDPAKVPVIDGVNPNVVTTKGGDTVTITGSNFQSGVKVFLDGSEILNIKRETDGKKITFTAPPGREAATEIQVMNPEGGIATWPFRYVKTYTEPKIKSFAPKAGTKDTLVVVRGQSFVKPDPTASPGDIDRLIGTRILLGGKDINEYNHSAVSPKNIELREYSGLNENVKDPVFYEAGKLQLADYFHSVILTPVGEPAHYYVLDTDREGRIILTDGQLNEYTLRYEEGTGIVADKGADGKFRLSFDRNTGILQLVKVTDLSTLSFLLQTPYKIENGAITGDRVRVVDIGDNGTIFFTVPALFTDGYYDLTVVNPDTSKDTKTEKEGFFYYSVPASMPQITGISPSKGSVAGGYPIAITGSGFQSTSAGKAKVVINGVEVSPEDTLVSPDGTTVWAKVPPYQGDLLKDKGVNTLSVPVVVVNPDGGSVSTEKLFSYVIDTSYPKITSLRPSQGSAAGGDIVEIFGAYFRMPDTGRTPDNLPSVYFGLRKAEPIDYNDWNSGYLKVKSPAAGAGQVNVCVVNPDGSVSNSLIFTYKASSPKISKIFPAAGRKQGGDRVEITGSGFATTKITRLTKNPDGTAQEEEIAMPLVRFGELTNRDIPRDQPGSGVVSGGEAEVSLPGGLKAHYSRINGTIDLTIAENGLLYTLAALPYSGNLRFIPVASLTDAEGNAYPGQELIRVEVADNRLIVERGYSPLTDYLSSGSLKVTVPSYYTIGKVTVYVINPDGGTAKGDFEYTNPFSNPVVTGIDPARGSISGGYYLEISGREFEDGALGKSRVYIGGVEVAPANVEVNASGTKITVKVPPYAGNLQKEGKTEQAVSVIILNPDGATAASPQDFTYMAPMSASPVITEIYPKSGPVFGGDMVEIKGGGFISPGGILPTVYFSKQKAEPIDIQSWSSGYLRVKTPAGTAGTTEVYVIRTGYDYAISNKMSFSYTASNPKIAQIVPNMGSKAGGEQVEIWGTGFYQSTVRTLTQNEENIELATCPAFLVRFGDITNRNIPREKENSGLITNNAASVSLSGGLKAVYNAGLLKLSLAQGSTEYVLELDEYDGNPLFIPSGILKNKDDPSSACPNAEWFRVEISDRRLIVERGYSPETKVTPGGPLTAVTPPYYTVGKVNVYVINPDGAQAKGEYEYKNPLSRPVITDILKGGISLPPANNQKIIPLTYKGGNVITIVGEGFEQGAVVQIGSEIMIKPENITYLLSQEPGGQDKLQFTMPKVPITAIETPYRVTVANGDGGTAFSDQAEPPIYIVFKAGESSPVITELSPEKGSGAGGYQVSIRGSGFMEGAIVYFGDTAVTGADVEEISSKELKVTVPPHSPGKVEVRVENPDYALSEPALFTYISNPVISSVTDPENPEKRLESISVEGGQTIRLTGAGFKDNIRVIFCPVLKQIGSLSEANGKEVLYSESGLYILQEGAPGTGVKVVDENTLEVITPMGKNGSSGVMVINPDGGASGIYDLIYGIPQADAPAEVNAELIDNSLIRVWWDGVKGANGYDVYVSIDGGSFQFAGSTTLTAYMYTKLQPDTKYRFAVKALGLYRASPLSPESNTVRTKKSPTIPDDDGELNSATTMERAGNKAVVSLANSAFTKTVVVDLRQGVLSGCESVSISIPAPALNSSGQIQVLGKDFTLRFSPSAFNIGLWQATKNREDAGIRFEISPAAGPAAESGRTVLSKTYLLSADAYTGREKTKIDGVKTPLEFYLSCDTAKMNLWKIRQISLDRFETASGRWFSVYTKPASLQDPAAGGYIYGLGHYQITGSR